MNETQFWIYYLGGVGFILFIFLLFRAVVLWYWKIDKIVELLTKIEKNTRKDEKKELPVGPDIVEKQEKEREENRKKVREYFETQSRATNDDIQRIFGVSDATATRYLEALEKEGLIRQVGGEGRGVYYEKI
ncbi:MAG: winged helix-turn-helix transcriptional regulator [Candidatus Niyogibacteria bacterium]|nr:winged helix-turn-helix transcriptional regulator [Candidatus Niyogibacteria bacterium]